jgi:hypothetical protein
MAMRTSSKYAIILTFIIVIGMDWMEELGHEMTAKWLSYTKTLNE